MPLDSMTLYALSAELRTRVVGAKIDKVQQPERDTILLTLHGVCGSFRLTLCGGVGCARVHITEARYENPAQPPMFCMLLRKHLVGARITALTQPERERIVIFELDALDEMGVPVKKRLVLELIGRGTNIILVDGDGRIIDCLRRVDAEKSALQQVLPGLMYRLPLNQSKPDFFALTASERRSIWENSDPRQSGDKRLLNSFACLSPLVCRELDFRAGGVSENMPAAMEALAETVEAGDFEPYMLLSDGKPRDFSFMHIRQYGEACTGETFVSFSELLDAFYTRRSRAEELRRRTQSLRRTVKNARDRTVRTLALREEELRATAGREEKRRRADLITANLYRLKSGQESVTVQDFYAEDCPMVTIKLDPLKTPQQNAAALYRDYARARTAEAHLTGLIADGRRDAEYLDSVLEELERVTCEADIAEIRRELTATGYLRQTRTAKRRRAEKPAAPLKYISSSGTEILVGRSNVQNDELTFRTAYRGDIWLHVQKLHGSHVIIRCAGEEADETTLAEAASLAALHSEAGEGAKVPVDFTRVRFVKKPPAARPGMVIYTDYSTVMAEGSFALAERLIKR
ncbi:MAG: NFACT family protein [Oscillospiraceae bacterium]|nr:NFACT family protein [Oscillospiraceae bacterium]